MFFTEMLSVMMLVVLIATACVISNQCSVYHLCFWFKLFSVLGMFISLQYPWYVHLSCLSFMHRNMAGNCPIFQVTFAVSIYRCCFISSFIDSRIFFFYGTMGKATPRSLIVPATSLCHITFVLLSLEPNHKEKR